MNIEDKERFKRAIDIIEEIEDINDRIEKLDNINVVKIEGPNGNVRLIGAGKIFKIVEDVIKADLSEQIEILKKELEEL